MPQIVKALRGGQITIPADLRETLGIDTDSLLQVRLEAGELRIKPVKITDYAADSAWLKKLYDHFAPIRQEAVQHSEREVNETIDQAVAAVRSKKHAKSRI